MKKIVFLSVLFLFSFGEYITQDFDLTQKKELDKGDFNGLYVDKNNSFRLTENVEKITHVDAKMVWGLLETKTDFFVYLSEKGAFYRIDKKTKKKKLIQIAPHGDIISMVRQGNTVYIALSKPSAIYSYSLKNNKVNKLLDIKARYIWDMKFRNGQLYVSTGSPGKILKIDLQKKKIQSFFDNKDENITKIEFHNKEMYAATSRIGYLYEIKDSKNYKIIYNAHSSDISDFVFKGEDIYITTAAEVKNRIHGKNYLIKINKNGKIKPLYVSDNLLTCASIDKNRIIFATYDMTGSYLYSYSFKNKKIKELYRTDKNRSTFVNGFSNTKNGFSFVTSSGDVYRLRRSTKASGNYISPILDSRSLGTWGSVQYQTNSRSRTQIFTRSGMTSVIDKNWSKWINLGQQKRIMSSTSRYIQVKVVYNNQRINKGVELWGLKLYYSVPTIQMQITNFLVTRDEDLAKKLKINMGVDKLLFYWQKQLNYSDPISYKIYFKRSNQLKWIKLVDNLYDQSFMVNRFLFSEGYYDFKLVMSTGYKQSDSQKVLKRILIDNTPPHAELKYKQSNILGLRVTDSLGYIKRVKYSFDRFKGDWYSLTPVDGVMDNGVENFTVKISDKKAKELFLYMEDNSGNYLYKVITLKN